MVSFFGIAFVITAILVFLFTHSVRLTLLPLFCSIVAVAWTLGLLTAAGFGLDPMSLLVPFLILAIGVSHGVQMVNAMGTATDEGHDGLMAARLAFRNLATPSIAALLIGLLLGHCAGLSLDDGSRFGIMASPREDVGAIDRSAAALAIA